ncbi:MAG: VTT domain-containing protein [Spirochaeta sp.]
MLPKLKKIRQRLKRRKSLEILKLAALAVGFVLFWYFALFPLAEYVETAGTWLALHVGLGGVALYVYIVDTFILPATTDLLFPFVLDWPLIPLLTVISTASVAAGCSGYALGRGLNHFSAIEKRTQAWEKSHSELIETRGLWAIAAAAALPIPFSTVSWLAGALRMRFSHYFLGALFRIPRMVITFVLIKEGVTLLV